MEQLKCTFRGSGLVTLEFTNILSHTVTKDTPIRYTLVHRGKHPDKSGTYVVSNDAAPGAVIGWQGFSDDIPGKSCAATISSAIEEGQSAASRQRSGRKNSLMSRARSSGCSIAAKWPPFGISVQRVML